MKSLLCLLLCLFASAALAADLLEGSFKVVQVAKDGVLVSGACETERGSGLQVVKLAFLSGVTGKVEEDKIMAWVKIDGSHTFTDTAGASRTVRKYTLVKLQP